MIRPKAIVAALTLGLVSAFLVAAPTATTGKVKWLTYKSNVLNIQVSVPSSWAPVKIPNALAFHYDDLVGGTAAIGFLKSGMTGSIEEAADKQFEHEGQPADWIRSPASVDGHRAIKIVGAVRNNPSRKMVHYYIETPNGIYLVQCQGDAERWSSFGSTFATILSKLKFL